MHYNSSHHYIHAGVNPKDHADKSIQSVLIEMSPTGWGIDNCFDCTGNCDVMRSALEASQELSLLHNGPS